MMTNNIGELLSFLNQMPDNFEVLEEGIDEKTQQEYIMCSCMLADADSPHFEALLNHENGKGVLNLEPLLFDEVESHKMQDGSSPSGNLESCILPLDSSMKKEALVLLARSGEIPAFRTIERFYKQLPAGDPLRAWTSLAMQECRMFIEGELGSGSRGFISGGMGGMAGKLRYYVVIIPLLEGGAFTELQKKVINDEFRYMSPNYHCHIEEVDLSADRYVGIKVLIPIEVSVAPYVESVIRQCNDLGEFVFDGAYVTNKRIPQAEEMDEVMRIVRTG